VATTAPIALLLGMRENRWSDMLAFLYSLDPEPLRGLIRDRTDIVLPTVTELHREFRHEGDRFDILLTVGGEPAVIFEVKLLAHLDLRQLTSYENKVADETACFGVGLSDLTRTVRLATQRRWGFITWAEILDEFSRSTEPVVSQLAIMWRAHHDTLVRPPGIDTRSIRLNDHTTLTIQQKVAYIAEHVAREITEAVDTARPVFTLIDVGVSTSGFPLLTVETWPIERPDATSVCVRIEFGYPRDRPVMHVMVAQHGVDTSAVFPWPLVGVLRVATAPYARALNLKTKGGWSQRTDHERVAATAADIPRAFTYGFGERQALKRGWCGFGCSPAVATDATTADVLALLSSSVRLAVDVHDRLVTRLGQNGPDQ
jgi:hypothetical protein